MHSPHPFARLPAFAGAVLLVFCAGCNTGPRSSVDGRVSYAGHPVDTGGIAFIPVENGGGQSVTGQIHAGRYTLDGHSGPMPGKYRIEITWRKKTGNKVPGEGEHLRDEIVMGIPPKYNSESELVRDVKAGRNTLDFDLTE